MSLQTAARCCGSPRPLLTLTEASLDGIDMNGETAPGRRAHTGQCANFNVLRFVDEYRLHGLACSYWPISGYHLLSTRLGS
jgi:hypothetical protein